MDYGGMALYFEMPFNRLNHAVLGEIRPRFRLSTSLEPADVFLHLKAQVAEDDQVIGTVLKDYAILKIPNEHVHYWSPELQIRAEKDEYGTQQTIIRCLVGPRQSVWLLFTFFYLLMGVFTLFGGLYGLSQMNLGESSPFIWCLPLGLLLIPGLWLIAKIGQKTGRDQMLHLISVLYHTLGAHGTVERTE